MTAADWLREHDLANDDGLLLRRVIDGSGRSRAYLNGSPATLTQLREIAEVLVDIHGQHAHQSLLRGDAQRALLDAHARLEGVAAEATAWRAWRDAKALLDTAANDAQALAQEREQLQWQVGEVDALGLSPSEWDALNAEHKRLAHASSLAEGARYLLDLLAEGDAACSAQVDSVVRRVDALADYDPALAEVATLLQSAQAELAEAVSALRRYADRVELDPQRLADVERRIEAVLACARKYRAHPEDLPALLEGWQARLRELFAQYRRRRARSASARRAGVTTSWRATCPGGARAAVALAKDVSRVMQQLALGGGRFEVGLVPIEGGGAQGYEQVEFRIAGLAGDESRALAKVASVASCRASAWPTGRHQPGGERSDALVFDEVDVGIAAGWPKSSVACCANWAANARCCASPTCRRLAARANWQWRVIKSVGGGKVRSRVLPLDTGRVEEIARMLGGVEITAITRQHAREMLGFD